MIPPEALEDGDIMNPVALSTLCSVPFEEPADDADIRFDNAVALLEKLVHDEGFEARQQAFFLEHCEEFTDEEENKLIYTDIFNRYTAQIEDLVLLRLTIEIPGFDLEEFMELLEERHTEVSGEALDILASCTDFEAFKQTMLAVRQQEDQLDDRLEQALSRFFAADDAGIDDDDLDVRSVDDEDVAASETRAADDEGGPSTPLITPSPPPKPRNSIVGTRNLRRIVAEANK